MSFFLDTEDQARKGKGKVVQEKKLKQRVEKKRRQEWMKLS